MHAMTLHGEATHLIMQHTSRPQLWIHYRLGVECQASAWTARCLITCIVSILALVAMLAANGCMQYADTGTQAMAIWTLSFRGFGPTFGFGAALGRCRPAGDGGEPGPFSARLTPPAFRKWIREQKQLI
jgi:hypothetical protein